jgi:hypothetical protein
VKVVFVLIVDASALALFALFFTNVQVSVKTTLKVVFVVIVDAMALALFALFYMNVQVSVKMIFKVVFGFIADASALALFVLFFKFLHEVKVELKRFSDFCSTSLSQPSSLCTS